MKRQQLLFLHIFYWSVNIIGSIIVPYFLFENDKLIWDITFLITSVICFYFNYFFVVPQFFDINNLYKTILAFIVSVFCFVLVRYFMQEIFSPYFFGIRNYAEGTTFGYYFYDNIYYSSITIFVSTVFCLFKLMSKSEAEKRQLIEEKKNSELQALKTQINPHFIFNSLNNIYSLVY